MMTISFNSVMSKGPSLVAKKNKLGMNALTTLEKKIYAKYESIFKVK